MYIICRIPIEIKNNFNDLKYSLNFSGKLLSIKNPPNKNKLIFSPTVFKKITSFAINLV